MHEVGTCAAACTASCTASDMDVCLGTCCQDTSGLLMAEAAGHHGSWACCQHLSRLSPLCRHDEVRGPCISTCQRGAGAPGFRNGVEWLNCGTY